MRTTNRILGAVAAALVVWAGTACNKDLTNINRNPNGPVDVPPPSILPSIIHSAVDNLFGTWVGLKNGIIWTQQVAEIQYRDEDKYILRPGSTGLQWSLYNGPLNDAQLIIDKGVSSKTADWEAVGRIMKSWMFGILTDQFGDVPYSQALQGSAQPTPKYDAQKDVYTGIFADLAKAAGEIDPAGIGFQSGGDLLYGGDMTGWKKFAYSLMLRDAIHLSNVDPATATKEAQAAVAGGVFQSNDDNAQLMYLASNPNQNPIYRDHHVGGRDDYGMAKTFIDSLSSWKDPRLPIFAQPNVDGNYQGLSSGLNDGEGPPVKFISRIGALWRETPNSPMVLESYAEVLFLEAEAAQRGWISGNAASLYTQGITASMQQLSDLSTAAGGPGITQAQIAAYLAQPQVKYNPATGLQQIAYQKWIALFMNGPESWSEARRTGVPHLVPGPLAILSTIPKRIPYPDNEAVLNTSNFNSAMSAAGLSPTAPYVTTLAQPVWWEK